MLKHCFIQQEINDQIHLFSLEILCVSVFLWVCTHAWKVNSENGDIILM